MTPNEILKQYFGYDSFRPGQLEMINAVLECRDALAVMPTGAGKSICYQVPALILPGLTVVISPLISLMQDQVKALNEAGIRAAYINSALTEGQISRVLALAAEGTYRLLYVAPERLGSPAFRAFSVNTRISMVTVDEAHCISQWGQDFRPSYLKITDYIRQLPERPVIAAFTATATPRVQEDICQALALQAPLVQRAGFDRPNLDFQVETPSRKDAFVLNYLEDHAGQSGIIYCSTRKNVDALFEKLFKQGISVARYHAGMETLERRQSQEDFVYDRVQIIIATNAFGMGIDKSNVRFVLHYNMPQSMENYYQEAGRAGRDGEPAECILLYSAQDVITCRMLLDNKDYAAADPAQIAVLKALDNHRLDVMENYCQTAGCLRNEILNYFGEQTEETCGHCGNCRAGIRMEDRTEAARQVIACVAETRGRYGMKTVTGILTGARRSRLREIGAEQYACFGVLKGTDENEIVLLIRQMLNQDYLRRTQDRYGMLRRGPRADELNRENAQLYVQLRDRPRQISGKLQGRSGKAKGHSRHSAVGELTSEDFKLFEQLRTLRLEIARERQMPPYIVFSDKTLIDMCRRRPGTEQEMLAVSGVGEYKYAQYGQIFMEAIAAFGAGEKEEQMVADANTENFGAEEKEQQVVVNANSMNSAETEVNQRAEVDAYPVDFGEAEGEPQAVTGQSSGVIAEDAGASDRL